MTHLLRRNGLILCLLTFALGSALYGAGPLPKADDLIAKHIEAAGGEKAIRATKSMHATGKMEMPAMGVSATLTLSAMAPNKVLMSIDMPGMGVVNNGFDGEVAWSDNPMTGPMILEGEMATQTVKEADFYSELNYAKKYPTRETVEQVDFAGEPAYKVRMVDTEGKESFEFFSVASGLLIGREGEQMSEMGTMFVTTELSDYRKVSGRMVPMSSTAKMAGMEMKMTFDEVTFDQVEKDAFELPATIQTLLESKTGKDGV